MRRNLGRLNGLLERNRRPRKNFAPLRISDFGLLSAFDLRPSDFRLRRPVPFANEYAHKPWGIFHNGVVYHFYCACGDQGRVIAVATSKDLKK